MQHECKLKCVGLYAQASFQVYDGFGDAVEVTGLDSCCVLFSPVLHVVQELRVRSSHHFQYGIRIVRLCWVLKVAIRHEIQRI